MNKIILFTCISLSVSISMMSEETFAFRCGNTVVTTGASKYNVQATCGSPDSTEVVQSQTEGTFGSSTSRNSRNTQTTFGRYAENTVLIENWTYDCGPNDFVYVLTFEGDKFIKEDTKGRGNKSGGCLSAAEKRNLAPQTQRGGALENKGYIHPPPRDETTTKCGEWCTGPTLYDARQCHIRQAMEIYSSKPKNIAFEMYSKQCLTAQERELYPILITAEEEEKLKSTTIPELHSDEAEEPKGASINQCVDSYGNIIISDNPPKDAKCNEKSLGILATKKSPPIKEGKNIKGESPEVIAQDTGNDSYGRPARRPLSLCDERKRHLAKARELFPNENNISHYFKMYREQYMSDEERQLFPLTVTRYTDPCTRQRRAISANLPADNTHGNYLGIKGIILNNGRVIDGQILYMDDEIVKIRTKEGKVIVYSIAVEVKKIVKE